MQPPDMLRIVRGRGWVDMNFNPQFSNAMAVDACGARVSPGQAAPAARADDDSRVALAIASFLSTFARNVQTQPAPFYKARDAPGPICLI